MIPVGSKRYNCPTCPKKLVGNESYRRHLLLVHSVYLDKCSTQEKNRAQIHHEQYYSCHKICDKLAVKLTSYNDGIRYCSTCSVFLKGDYKKCPCCHHKLRTNPHRPTGNNRPQEDSRRRIE